MSIALEKMYSYLPQFDEMASMAEKLNVSFEVNISPTGDISFKSIESNSDCLRYNIIRKGKDHVGESKFTYKLGTKKER